MLRRSCSIATHFTVFTPEESVPPRVQEKHAERNLTVIEVRLNLRYKETEKKPTSWCGDTSWVPKGIFGEFLVWKQTQFLSDEGIQSIRWKAQAKPIKPIAARPVMVVFVGGKIYGFAMVMMMIKLSRYSPRIDEMVHGRRRQCVGAVFGTSLLDLVVRNERLWKGDFLKVKSFDYLTTREWIRKLQLHYIFECIELLFGIQISIKWLYFLFQPDENPNQW